MYATRFTVKAFSGTTPAFGIWLDIEMFRV